jgi:hypothetical protein
MTPKSELIQMAAGLEVPCEITGGSHADFVITMETGEVEESATFERAVEIIREYAKGTTTDL